MQEAPIKKLEDAVRTATEERKSLGLSLPKKCDFFIGMCDVASDGCAVAYQTNAGPAVVVNLLPLFLEQAEARHAELGQEIAEYFDIARDFFNTPHEEPILELITHPRKTIQIFESSFSKKKLRMYQSIFQERGKPYSRYKRWLTKNAKHIRALLKKLTPHILRAFEHQEIEDTVRHELDHADFFQTALHQKYDHYVQQLNALDESSKQYIRVEKKLLHSFIEVYSLIEPRAHFFSYIPKDQWRDSDMAHVKKHVCATVITEYVENEYTFALLESLNSLSLKEGNIDTVTTNYLFHKVYAQSQSIHAQQYVVDPEKVNYSVANMILYEQLPALKKRMADNIILAVDALGNAFSQNPSRITKANKARTFDEFIEIVSRVR